MCACFRNIFMDLNKVLGNDIKGFMTLYCLLVSLCNYESCVYLKRKLYEVLVYLLLYVDDILIASGYKSEIFEIRKLLSSEFEMKDLGTAKKILGMEILRDRGRRSLVLSQRLYIEKVIARFNMLKSKTVTTPLGQQFKLSIAQAPQTDEEKQYMSQDPYAS